MTTKLAGADAIRNFAKSYKAMVEIADMLEDLGKIEQVTAEQQKAADAARAEADKVKADLVKAKAKVAEAEAKAQDIVAVAQEQAAQTGAGIVRAAQEDAALVAKKAQDEASKMIAQASTEKARLSSEIGGLQSAIESAKTELQILARAKDDAEAATADAEKKLDQIKGKLKALLD